MGVRNGVFCVHMLIQQILKIQQIRILGARIASIIFPKRTEMCLPGTLRVSFGVENDETDVKILIHTIKKINQNPKPLLNKILAHTNNGTLFIPITKTEERIKQFVELRTKKVYSIKKK
ncbi:MAG: hypothetical protein ACFE9T_01855 [Promethearchaeota archaeon]